VALAGEIALLFQTRAIGLSVSNRIAASTLRRCARVVSHCFSHPRCDQPHKTS
jgi:hypothetical protein